MNLESFQALITTLPTGKSTPKAIYIHRSAIEGTALCAFLDRILAALKQTTLPWNVAKLFKSEFQFSLLCYPNFEVQAYPELNRSLFVDLEKKHHKINDYQDIDNPPILHRKELMVLESHPLYDEFSIITQEGEQAGLYENARTIGFKLGWEAKLLKYGYTLVDGRLFRDSAVVTSNKKIDRHKTAIVRRGLSAPFKLLQKKGYLDGGHTVFDYGCGLGDDLAELQSNGISASGWDPNFRPDDDIDSADIVNLGFVLNVIEDFEERIGAIQRAFELAEKFLIVSCMLMSEARLAQYTPYKDGVLTSRNTFQKYYFQSELQLFIEESLEQRAISAGPGIFMVFKDKLEEQRYLSARFKRKTSWLPKTQLVSRGAKTAYLLEEYHDLVERFWEKVIELGRLPVDTELDEGDRVAEYFGSPKKLFNLIIDDEKQKELTNSQNRRRDDYLTDFAMECFDKRSPYQYMPDDKKRDIKALFVNISEARDLAKNALFRIADTDRLIEAAGEACRNLPAYIYNKEHSLLLQSKYVNDLPLMLRIYVGVAAYYYGEWESADVVKIHLTSNKVSFMVYDNFDGLAIPALVERVKVKLSEQDIDYFDYINEAKRPPLTNKNELMAETEENFEHQRRLDLKLLHHNVVPGTGEQHIARAEFIMKMSKLGKRIKGYRLFNV
ncbi:DNA phosphorothioation-associated putative methyltransferase [Alteromonas ponticola]|uniref:DNA phosphorothioation-associated putative methyltransferase n=1 Tax=Alteromonas aquimaris TaxID=2998417 RepID=A0ABT3P4S3_9ALTE|nr:DNA phosphorothioation-associated putative methyltransferase [Alteromonas aquimaris]MCW8107116.1 DNA phosphorothioation-associated putative methyltransferase [Alteromonas aquimaris]